MSDPSADPRLFASAVRRELLRLAASEDDLAATEAAAVPYWAHHPPCIQAHRTAASVLRRQADRFLVAS